MKTNVPRGQASIIIPYCIPLESTRQCIAALRRYTRAPWELIVVDNGSADETAAYLTSVQAEAPVPVSVIAVTRASGLPAAINQGLLAACGEYLVLLSNDVVVTDGWLDQLIGLADCHERRVGLVGPMFNEGASPQSVGAVPYHDLLSMHDFARRWRDEHRGRWFTVGRLSGACLLMTRDVYQAIGGLDEQSGADGWADELAMRAQRAGYVLAVAHDLFVHQESAWIAGWMRAASSWDQVPGFFDFAAVYDAAVAAARDGDVFVEVGCLAGRSTCYLATRIRDSGKAITLYAVDPSTGSPSDSTGRVIAPAVGGTFAGILHRNILGCGLEQIVVPIVTTSVRAANLFGDETIAFCFIDADHSYESVTADLNAWWPKVRPGGMLAGHDYRQPAPWLSGLTPAVHNFFAVQDATHPAMPGCWAMVKQRPANEASAISGHPSGAGRTMKPIRDPRRKATKVLFASVHSILDFSNGASVATLDALQGLSTQGFECEAFCTAKVDLLQTEVSLEKMIGDLGEPLDVHPSVCGDDRRGFTTRGAGKFRSRSSPKQRLDPPSRAWKRLRPSCHSSPSILTLTGLVFCSPMAAMR